MENFYYLYVTTNLTNGKKYIGQHCTHDLNDGYYGSCKELIKDIKSGHEYKVKILKYFKNIYNLGFAEFMEIKKKNAIKNENYYNKDGRIYFNYCFVRNKKVIKAVSKGVRKAFKNMSEEKKKIRSEHMKEAQKDRAPVSKEVRKKISKTLTGRKAKPETIEKRKRTLDIKFAEQRIKRKAEREYRKLHAYDHLKGSGNPMYGKGYKISGSKNGSYGKGNSTGSHWKTKLYDKPCIYCGKITTKSAITRFHNENCKHKLDKCV
jgi:hypothetical protein